MDCRGSERWVLSECSHEVLKDRAAWWRKPALPPRTKDRLLQEGLGPKSYK